MLLIPHFGTYVAPDHVSLYSADAAVLSNLSGQLGITTPTPVQLDASAPSRSDGEGRPCQCKYRIRKKLELTHGGIMSHSA